MKKRIVSNPNYRLLFMSNIAYISFFALCCSQWLCANAASAMPTRSDSVPAQVRYTWLPNARPQTNQTLLHAIPTPAGYQRVTVAKGSWAEWLRYLPMMDKGTKVLLFNGQQKSYQEGAYRVINLDVGTKDLQQCADAVMRLKAEYNYSRSEFAKIHFNFTSGDRVSFDDWRKGRKPKVGKGVQFSAATGKEDNSYDNFKKYLQSVFSYAGTASLEKELTPAQVADIQAGDVFIKGGFPGHAVLVLDVAEHPTTRERVFLLAQSYMPAQSMHVLINPNDAKMSPWYKLRNDEALVTPEWSFPARVLRRFKD